MKFLLRSLLVIIVAVASGIVLYYAVQALPGNPAPSSGPRIEPPTRGNAQNLPPGPERPENGRGAGFQPRALIGVAGKTILFSVLVTISVLAKNLIFKRKSKGKNSSD